MANFKISNKAKGDLKAIAHYTQSKWGRAQRNKYLGQLDAAFYALAKKPMKGKDCSDIREGYRRYIIERHMIYYRQLSADQILIVRVLHDRMDPELHL